MLKTLIPVRKSDQKEVTIRWLTVALIITIGLVMHAHYRMAKMPENFTVYHPPNLAAGGHSKVNEVPGHVAYAFAFRFYQNIESCQENCQQDRLRNIDRFRWYMSEEFYSQRRRTAQATLRQDGALTVHISEYSHYSFEDVRPISSGVWVVLLTVRKTERIGSRLISDAVYEIPVRVVSRDVDRSQNPWRLGIDGLQGEARRVRSLMEDV